MDEVTQNVRVRSSTLVCRWRRVYLNDEDFLSTSLRFLGPNCCHSLLRRWGIPRVSDEQDAGSHLDEQAVVDMLAAYNNRSIRVAEGLTPEQYFKEAKILELCHAISEKQHERCAS